MKGGGVQGNGQMVEICFSLVLLDASKTGRFKEVDWDKFKDTHL